MTVRPIKTNVTEVVFEQQPPVRLLFSYETLVAAQIQGCYYKTSYFWSKTTNKHISLWLSSNGQTEAVEKSQRWFDTLAQSCRCIVPKNLNLGEEYE